MRYVLHFAPAWRSRYHICFWTGDMGIQTANPFEGGREGEMYSLVSSSYSPLKRTRQIRVQFTRPGETGRAGRGFNMRHCEFVCRSPVLSLSIKGGQAADESRYGLLCIPQFISPFPSCRVKPLCTNSFVCELAFSYCLACVSISILNHPSLLHLAPP